MNITEFLQFADELIFAKTGKHLSNLQKTVLQGVWRNMNYEAIAKTVHRDEQYLRNVGSDLWKILTEALGEKINKANAISVIEREIVIKSNQDTTNFVGIGNLNLFSSCDSHQNQQEDESRQQVHQDWNSFDCGNPDFATKVSRFYGRDQEIDTLENWIFNCFNRLISVVGITGIGKTLLARKLIELHADNFEKICWRSLQLKPSIDSILGDLLQSFSIKVSVSESLDSKLSQFIEVLKKQRCLIVFDDVHYLFKKENLSGNYESAYQAYSVFFKRLAEFQHLSCLLLLSQEQPKEILRLSSQNSYVNSLELKSLGKAAENILSLKELEDEQTWAKLIELYSGNPLWLETIAETIKELANGKVSTLFTSNSPLLTEELQDSLWSIFSRLTDFERIIIINLAKTKTQESLNLEQLRNLISVSEIELVSALRSLRRRFLVETENNSQFTVTPVIREFALILE